MGCKRTGLDRKLTGLWSIDINAEVVERNNWGDMLGNGISLRSDFTCRIPGFMIEETNDRYNSEGTWQSLSVDGRDSLIIDVKDHPMNGRYKIEFYRDTKKELLKMRISNSTTEFTCAKFFQDPDRVSNW